MAPIKIQILPVCWTGKNKPPNHGSHMLISHRICTRPLLRFWSKIYSKFNAQQIHLRLLDNFHVKLCLSSQNIVQIPPTKIEISDTILIIHSSSSGLESKWGIYSVIANMKNM